MRRNDQFYIHNGGRLWDTWVHYLKFASVQEEAHTKVFQKMYNKWTGWKPITEEQSVKFKKEVMINNDGVEEDFATIQKTPRARSGKVVHRTKAQREKEIMSTPDNVRLREEAAARCTEKIKRGVLRKQARKAGAEHLVKCSMEPGKKKTESKPLTELYVKGQFTEDREEWQNKTSKAL